MARTIYVKNKLDAVVYQVDTSDPPAQTWPFVPNDYTLQSQRMKLCAEMQCKFNPTDPYYAVDSAGVVLWPKQCSECGNPLPVT